MTPEELGGSGPIERAGQYRLDDIDNGRRFVDRFGGVVRWAWDSKQWWAWNAGAHVWEAADEVMHQMAGEVAQDVYAEATALRARARAATESDPVLVKRAGAQMAWARYVAGVGHDRMLTRARSDPRVAVVMADFDSDPLLLNTPGGVVDLRTGMCSAVGRPEALMTRRAAAVPGAEWRGGLWEDFLSVVLPDKEVREYLQVVMGYGLIWGVEERLLVFLVGGTGHGKSKFADAVDGAWGSYSVSLASDQLLVRAADQYGLARLPGARLVQAAEFEERAKVNRALVKRLSSGEETVVRPIRGVPFPYRPGGTLLVTTNTVPFVGGDDATWARMLLVPFPVELVPGELGREDLSVSLRCAEVAGQVLGWAVEGAAAYLRRCAAEGSGWLHGAAPAAVREAATDERESQRSYCLRFLEEAFVPVADPAGGWQAAADLQAALELWAAREGVTASEMLRADWVGRKWKAAGFERGRSNGVRFWRVGVTREGVGCLMGEVERRLRVGWRKDVGGGYELDACSGGGG